MLDSGSMACTLSTNMVPQLLHHAVLQTPTLQPTDVVLIGCGGLRTVPSGVCDIMVEMYGCKVVVPMLVVTGQSEDLILGSNLMRYLGNRLREEGDLGGECSKTLSAEEQPNKNLLSSMSGVVAPGHVGDKIGTVKLKRAVTLEPLTEHLVWGRMQLVNSGEVGSAVVVEPTGSRSGPRSVMVGRTVAHLNSDGWLPVKVLNPFDKPLTLKRNMKLADVSPCAAVENFTPTGSYLQQNMQRSTSPAWCHDEQSLVTDVSALPDDSPSQEMTGPMAFASKTLNHAQSKYPAHRLEFFALKWAVCDKFHHWLRGHQFTVWTDNNPLTYILSKPRLDACEQRWIAKLAPFQFDIKYIPGPKNVVADALSREPFVHPRASHRLIRVPYNELLAEAGAVATGGVQDAFRWTVHLAEKASSTDQPVVSQCMAVEQAGMLTSSEVGAVFQAHSEHESRVWPHALLLPQCSQTVLPPNQSASEPFSHDDLVGHQRRDDVLCRVISYVERGQRPSRRERASEPVDMKRLLRAWDKLTMRDGVLYRVSKNPVTKTKTYLYVVPPTLRLAVLKGVHDEAGHQGQQRTLYLARHRFYWPDFWSAEDSANKSVDVLVVTDHFTKMAQAFLCPNQSAKAVAHQLWHNYFCIYGFPKRLHSDQGANFESVLIAELLNVAGVQKSHTTPYHPMGNGSCERMNRTLGNMIRALPPRAKQRWPDALKALTFAYNCTVHETTGYVPFLLMFGRVPRLPIDVIFGSVIERQDIVDYDRYVQTLRRDLKEALDLAQEGRGKRKLADRWESVVYTVFDKNDESHTFKLMDDSTGRVKVVHRNLIMPVNFLPLSGASVQDDGDELSESGSMMVGCDGEAVCNSSVGTAEYRTRAWVSDLPSAVSSNSLMTEVAQPEGSILDQELACTSVPPVDTEEQVNATSGGQHSDLLMSVAPVTVSSVLELAATTDGDQDNTAAVKGHVSTNADPTDVSRVVGARARSRVGRLLKPVFRLIEMMHQKPVEV
ncbi:unnamed protein product [Oreochromis niloticus]|nr:unnamed protein product [Mustela putorius furo]